MINKSKVEQFLRQLFPPQELSKVQTDLENMFEKFLKETFKSVSEISEKNVYLITYGDAFLEEKRPPIQVLRDIVTETLADTITDIHILPMFPYTSDDGFSVTDYYQIDPGLGDWSDIQLLSKEKRLMFDFVANHMSKSSQWFKQFLEGSEDFQSAFIRFDPSFDTSNVIRPRTSPLFHSYLNESQEKVTAWTTFSEDQVDVNIKDPKMFVRLTEVLLTYAQRGASSIRLDAIGFLWKESGTSCMHLSQTHTIIKLWHYLLSELAPNTQIITETNVPHKDNISYFGSGIDEANQIYQFPLPPLVLHSFITNSATKLSEWAATIQKVSKTATYFNFLASHDGIGLRPTEGILTDAERENLVQHVLKNGGKVSYKNNPDGTQSVYEMNINYSSALNDFEQPAMTEQKMIAAHHILLSVIGVPAIYYHSIFGSKNDLSGYEESGINRRINREKIERLTLLNELENDSYRKKIYNGISDLIRVRQTEPCFDPYGNQQVLMIDERIFALERTKGNEKVVCLTNVSNQEIVIKNVMGLELLTNKKVNGRFALGPFATAWIKGEIENGNCNTH